LCRSRQRLRILLSEGSSLSARQTLYALGRAGHRLELLDSDPSACLGRYSRYARAVHRCPAFAADPAGYLQAVHAFVQLANFDVLFPTHDQVYLLSRCVELFQGKVALAVPPFEAIERVQGKADFVRTLDALNLPHPPTTFARTREELEGATLPCYLKLPFSTAGRDVWLVRDREDLRRVVNWLESAGRLTGGEILIQQPAPGILAVVQSVFQRGTLVASHCYQARALGAGGSACARESVDHPLVREHLATLGMHLHWHGALMLDYLVDPTTGRPSYIDANPRIGETLNATLSGVNLCDELVRVALDEEVAPLPPGRVGVRTHSLIGALLGLAHTGKTRTQLLGEAWRVETGVGPYADSQDELIRPGEDFRSLLPAVYVLGRLLAHPGSADDLVAGAVTRYALTESAARTIREMPMGPH
jgi:predicted ATP-grasp superfamily ATP-dependent carboligase